jgi:hypothetical protein
VGSLHEDDPPTLQPATKAIATSDDAHNGCLQPVELLMGTQPLGSDRAACRQGGGLHGGLQLLGRPDLGIGELKRGEENSGAVTEHKGLVVVGGEHLNPCHRATRRW